jgi:hypothetical protein
MGFSPQKKERLLFTTELLKYAWVGFGLKPIYGTIFFVHELKLVATESCLYGLRKQSILSARQCRAKQRGHQLPRPSGRGTND